MGSYARSIVRIQRAGEAAIGKSVGGGVVLDEHRVLTCAHVVNEALGRDFFEAEIPEGSVILTVPLRDGGDTTFEATVLPELWRPASRTPRFGEAEDVAVLRLAKPETFPDDVAAAPLIDLDLGDEHDRRVWLTGFPGGPSDRVAGLIHGVNDEGRIQIDPALEHRLVRPGFSGAGIWDERAAGVVGILVTRRERDGVWIAYGVPTTVIAKALHLTTREATGGVSLATAQALGTLIVDVMRLLYSLGSEEAWTANRDRFPIFLDIAGQHTEELRLTVSRDLPAKASIDTLGRIERELAWILGHVRRHSDVSFDLGRCFEVALRVAEATYQIFARDISGELARAEAIVEAAFVAVPMTGADHSAGGIECFLLRQDIQTALLAGTIPTIAHDAAQDFSLGYFLIDRRILIAGGFQGEARRIKRT